jgi:hypothetical protein
LSVAVSSNQHRIAKYAFDFLLVTRLKHGDIVGKTGSATPATVGQTKDDLMLALDVRRFGKTNGFGTNPLESPFDGLRVALQSHHLGCLIGKH